MRVFVLILGCLFGVAIVGQAGIFGFNTSANILDGCTAAFLYGALALGGLIIHFCGIRLVTHYDRPRIGTITILIGLVLLAVSLTNNIDATAERFNATQARRAQTAQSVQDDRRDLKRMQDEREALRFDPTDWSAVSAARAKADAATAVRKAECDKRGPLCRGKEIEEEAALAGAEKAGRDKAATDRASELDKAIPLLKEKIAGVGPVLQTSSHGKALASIFSLQGDASNRQFTLMNVGLEIVTFCLFVLYELMAPKETSRREEPIPFKPKRTYRKRQIHAGQGATVIQMPRPDTAQIVKLYDSGKKHREIADFLGISEKTVQRRLKEHRSENLAEAGA